ncbi:MAG: Major Facilitator Superfamily Protein [Paenibacillaceae bacterium]|jgi:MFS family permease|nr:Major Facilitator Superfamily Protein [Paenibacillaceae bacterium]
MERWMETDDASKGNRPLEKPRTGLSRKWLILFIVSFSIAGLLMLTSVLNIVAFRQNYRESAANNNAILASGVVNKLQYSLKYGKELENYYGIEDLFAELKETCPDAEQAYIIGADGRMLYSRGYRQEGASAYTGEDASYTGGAEGKLPQLIREKQALFWSGEEAQELLLPVLNERGEVIGGLGLAYRLDTLDRQIRIYTREMVLQTALPALAGVFLFAVLFLLADHRYRFKRLMAIVIPVVILSNAWFGAASYIVYKKGYLHLVELTADSLQSRIVTDISSVVNQGVPYGELHDLESYFRTILERTDQLKSIRLAVEEDAGGSDREYLYPLDRDQEGDKRYLGIEVSPQYVQDRLNGFMIEIAASVVTSLMIAAEVIMFFLSMLTAGSVGARQGRRAGTVRKTADMTVQPLGVVRGLFFFFAAFQYMSMAFVPIVMTQIYRPIAGLPYEIAMSLPITVQILASILSAWISGKLVDRWGWRPVAVAGLAVMIAGTLLSAASGDPLSFIGSQVVLGLGAGCAKTAFDIFGVLVPSSGNLEKFTSGTNAGLIAGMSCSAALGAVIAEVVGFSAAFLVMAVIGVLVIAMVLLLGVNIIAPSQESAAEAVAAGGEDSSGQGVHSGKEGSGSGGKARGLDGKFIGYILLLVIPYFFISMYLDYYFPVYADSQGLSTANIGHIFLLYGIMTSYVGAYLCRVLTPVIRTTALMSLLLLVMAVFMSVSALWNSVALAAFFVLLMGTVDGIMPSLQYRYVLSLDIARRLGISRAIGIEGAFSGAIRGVAPVVFGLAMIYGGLGIAAAGGIVLAAAVLFALVNNSSEHKGVMMDG